MSDDYLIRGALVAYLEKDDQRTLYYYQQNGPGCLLYRHREDIGNPDKASLAFINHLRIRRATAEEVEAHGRPEAARPPPSPRDWRVVECFLYLLILWMWVFVLN